MCSIITCPQKTVTIIGNGKHSATRDILKWVINPVTIEAMLGSDVHYITKTSYQN